MTSKVEHAAMRAAVELSGRALGRTSPNPPVGCVVLDGSGATVGKGWTQPPGGPHAEVVALAEAGERARGGTAVVTLEPCRHTGRTGPCTQALLDAGVVRVVYAQPDPTARAAGGAAHLHEHGVDTQHLATDPGPLQPWLTAQHTGRPFLTWKYAATLDGRSAAADGTSRWVTGAAARADVHRLRDEVDAVLVGVGTVLIDDPRLDVRPAPADGRQPLRVVLDSHGRTPSSARCLQGPQPALVATAAPGGTLKVPLADDGRLDLLEVLHALRREHGVVSVLLEGGPTLAGAFLAAGLVDRVVGFVAPVLLGDGPHALSGAGVGTISDALRLTLDDVTRIGDDLRLTLRPADGRG